MEENEISVVNQIYESFGCDLSLDEINWLKKKHIINIFTAEKNSEELKNYSIDISFKLNDNPEHEVKFLTGKDKFAAMARKNPNLHTLKSTFNLDIEF